LDDKINLDLVLIHHQTFSRNSTAGLRLADGMYHDASTIRYSGFSNEDKIKGRARNIFFLQQQPSLIIFQMHLFA
jgi:hypothetical protein